MWTDMVFTFFNCGVSLNLMLHICTQGTKWIDSLLYCEKKTLKDKTAHLPVSREAQKQENLQLHGLYYKPIISTYLTQPTQQKHVHCSTRPIPGKYHTRQITNVTYRRIHNLESQPWGYFVPLVYWLLFLSDINYFRLHISMSSFNCEAWAMSAEFP
jgi:hypothetical protein